MGAILSNQTLRGNSGCRLWLRRVDGRYEPAVLRSLQGGAREGAGDKAAVNAVRELLRLQAERPQSGLAPVAARLAVVEDNVGQGDDAGLLPGEPGLGVDLAEIDDAARARQLDSGLLLGLADRALLEALAGLARAARNGLLLAAERMLELLYEHDPALGRDAEGGRARVDARDPDVVHVRAGDGLVRVGIDGREEHVAHDADGEPRHDEVRDPLDLDLTLAPRAAVERTAVDLLDDLGDHRFLIIAGELLREAGARLHAFGQPQDLGVREGGDLDQRSIQGVIAEYDG